YGGKDTYGAAFGPDGTLYTVGDDGTLRRYAPGYNTKPKIAATQGGNQPFSIAVHPAGDRVAVGFRDSTAVEVYDAAMLDRRFPADTQGVDNGSLAAVTWSADGARLYAGGTYAKAGLRLI